jgi:ABC-2 type transport system ATP-binding protein
LVKEGATLLLTTHFLDEADRLADSIAVIDHGKVIALGTAEELKLKVGGERIELTVRNDDDLAPAREILSSVGVGQVTVDQDARQLAVPVGSGGDALIETVRGLDARGINPLDLALRRPTLDDVFLGLTGHVAEEVVDA